MQTASTLDASRQLDLLADVGDDEAEAVVAHQVGHVLPRSGGEVVEADDGVAPLDQTVAQVRAQEAGAAGHHDPAHWRPIPEYWKPIRRTAAGSSRLRASTMLGSAMAASTREKSSQRNSSHSVSTTRTRAPATAS